MRDLIASLARAVVGFRSLRGAGDPEAWRAGAGRAHLNVQVFGPWAEKVTQASEGTLKVEFIPGGVLGTEGQLLERVRSGVVDIAYDLPGYYSGRFVKTDVVALPFLYETSEQASRALWKLYEKGRISDEYEQVKTLGIVSVPNAIFMSTTPVEKIEDFKGKKIQASTKLRTKIALTLGAVPVLGAGDGPLPVAEQRRHRCRDAAMDRGSAVQAGRGCHQFPRGAARGSPMMFFMSKEKFDKLPPAAQKAIQDHSGEKFVREFSQFWDKVNREGRASIAAMPNRTIRTPGKEELETWKKFLAPVQETWLRDTPNGADLLKAYNDELANAGK